MRHCEEKSHLCCVFLIPEPRINEQKKFLSITMFRGVCYAVIINEIIVNFRLSRLLFIFLLLFFWLFVFSDIAVVAVTTQVNCV